MTPSRSVRARKIQIQLAAALVLAALPSFAEDAEIGSGDTKGAPGDAVARIQDLCRRMRPDSADLLVYELDWADSLDHARERAASENRPILLVANRAPCADLKNGHC